LEGGGGGRVGRGRGRGRSLEWGHRGQFWHLNRRNRSVKRGQREKSKSQLEGIWLFFFFLFFFSSSGKRTTGLCLQQRAYSISS
jgi:hypothetical protein